jgi:hypothetical protein
MAIHVMAGSLQGAAAMRCRPRRYVCSLVSAMAHHCALDTGFCYHLVVSSVLITPRSTAAMNQNIGESQALVQVDIYHEIN